MIPPKGAIPVTTHQPSPCKEPVNTTSSSDHLCNLTPITEGCHTGDNVEMEAGEQLAAEILDAISSGRDVYVLDQFIEGPDHLERARKVLIEKRDACSDADEAALLTSIIRGLEKG